MALLMFSAAACQKENEVLDGPKARYDYIYLHTGGALIEAHNSTLNCSKKATTMELEIISFMGLDKVQLVEGADFASIKEAPAFPPEREDLYEVMDNITDKYIQKITLFVDVNISSKEGRKAVLRLESPAYNGCVAEITVFQEGW